MSCSDGEKITVWGEGTEGRDLLYIDDLINAIDLILNNQLSRLFRLQCWVWKINQN